MGQVKKPCPRLTNSQKHFLKKEKNNSNKKIKKKVKGYSENSFEIQVINGSAIILSCFVGQTFHVQNGLKYSPVRISSEIVGFKIGSFVSTRVNTKKVSKLFFCFKMGQKVHPVGFRLQQHLKASNFAERVWQNLSFRFFESPKKNVNGN